MACIGQSLLITTLNSPGAYFANNFFLTVFVGYTQAQSMHIHYTAGTEDQTQASFSFNSINSLPRLLLFIFESAKECIYDLLPIYVIESQFRGKPDVAAGDEVSSTTSP